MDDMPTLVAVAELRESVRSLSHSVDQLRADVREYMGRESPFVTKDEFHPIRLTIYGVWTCIGLAVMSALLALVIVASHAGG
jgi:tetrahydromethanopterin S-methyltransferase subunit B